MKALAVVPEVLGGQRLQLRIKKFDEVTLSSTNDGASYDLAAAGILFIVHDAAQGLSFSSIEDHLVDENIYGGDCRPDELARHTAVVEAPTKVRIVQ